MAQKPSLPKEEVIRRLRLRKEPITLFGETDLQREERLKQLEAAAPDEYVGQRNDFYEELQRLEEQEHEEEERKKPKHDEFPLELNADGQPTSHEHYILMKFKEWLSEWERDLDEQPETMKRTAQGRVTIAMFKQTQRFLQPLLRALHQRTLAEDLVQLIHEIVLHIVERNYIAANESYLKLAIGNAPWPMGVTCVGIHERSAREKIEVGKVAHIMNDETQRKYIQSMKRIMTYLQKKYPADPSRNMG